jgi:hypothetical protein
MMKLALLILALASAPVLTACAGAPPGMRYANPNCVWSCTVEVVDAPGDSLATLTTTQGSTATGGTRTRTSTQTDTGP